MTKDKIPRPASWGGALARVLDNTPASDTEARLAIAAELGRVLGRQADEFDLRLQLLTDRQPSHPAPATAALKDLLLAPVRLAIDLALMQRGIEKPAPGLTDDDVLNFVAIGVPLDKALALRDLSNPAQGATAAPMRVGPQAPK